jgi:hypothetical protein
MIQVLGQIGVHHIRVAAAEQVVDGLDGIPGAPSRPIAVSVRFQIGLEDRLDHQLRGSLHHPVPDCRDTKRALAAVGLGDHHAPYRIGPIGPFTQYLSEARQPLLSPRRFDRRERHPVHPRCTAIGVCQPIGLFQDVPHLVVEQIEAVVRLRLRFEIELLLKVPDLFRCLEAHRQSPSPRLLPKHAGSQAPSLRRHYPASTVVWTCPTPDRTATKHGVRSCDLRPIGPPPITRIALPACCAHYPGGPERVRLPVPSRPTRPSPLPSRVGVRIATFEACSGFTRYGPLACSTAQGGLCHRAPARSVTQTSRLSATRSTG